MSRSYMFEGFELLESFTLLADAVTCGEQYDGHLKWQNNVILPIYSKSQILVQTVKGQC